MRNLLFTAFFFIIYQVQAQFDYKLDESKSDKDFQLFATELKDIIEKRDTARLFNVLADSISESNNGCGYGSKECFIQIMEFRKLGDSSWFWTEAEKLMNFGFAKSVSKYELRNLKIGQTTFQAPSFLKQIQRSNTYNLLFIHAEKVNIRKRPTIESEIVARISYDTLIYNYGMALDNINWPEYEEYGESDSIGNIWIQVQLPNREFGYVIERFTSLWTYKEMTITKVKGEWKIISFYHPSGC